ncbi:MAG: acyl-CoA carboxylase subunit beta [Verrucomicrobiales bacterium]|jgi:propionyl-CoA carboxylase beta chain|nr:acyl-CoA carboxylase subunit beta [Verrucomicrobiales bacterium]
MAIDQTLLETLKQRRAEALLAGGQDKIDARRKKGWMTARDRLAALFDAGTFQEFGQHVRHGCVNFGMEKKVFPSDGVVTGTGFVNGSPVAAFAQDFTVGGGSLGERHAKKICDAMDYALKSGIPVIGINDSGGARIQEGVAALSGYGNIFYRNVQLSGVVPQVTIIAGPCIGGAAYSPALTDFLIMVKGQATMAITGPSAIKAVTGQDVTMEDIGSAAANASISGNVHFVVDNDQQAIDLGKLLLSYLPSNNLIDPPHKTVPLPTGRDESINEIIPAAGNLPLDMQAVIKKIVDDGQFLEVHASFARNIIVGFARIGGIVTGIIANQPSVKAGTLDIDSSDKGARFIRFCNIFNIPIVNLVDVPGFLPGVPQEHGGIIRHGAKMLFAYAAATVPKITLIARKAYGGAYLAMCSKDLGADLVFAWPTAEIAVMGAEGAVGTLFKKEIDTAANPAEKRAELIKEYRDKFSTPYEAAGRGFVTDVIDPAETRGVLALALRTTLSKREARPAKKHGNIPL